jgi:hypothetical protein
LGVKRRWRSLRGRRRRLRLSGRRGGRGGGGRGGSLVRLTWMEGSLAMLLGRYMAVIDLGGLGEHSRSESVDCALPFLEILDTCYSSLGVCDHLPK